MISPMAIAEAKIKSRLAEFLTIEQELLKMQLSSSSKVRGKAQELYQEHMILDKKREDALKRVDKQKISGFSLVDSAVIISFSIAMEKHINEVVIFRQEAAGTLPKDGGWKIPWLPVIAVLLVIKILR